MLEYFGIYSFPWWWISPGCFSLGGIFHFSVPRSPRPPPRRREPGHSPFPCFSSCSFSFCCSFSWGKVRYRDKEKTLCDVDENWFLSTKLPYQPQFRLINNLGNHILNILINTAIITSIDHKSETCFCSSSTLLQDKLCSILPSPPDSTLQSTLLQTVMVVKSYLSGWSLVVDSG